MNKSNISIKSHDGKIKTETGQLAVDVYSNEKEIVIIAPIAGVSEEDINLTINEEILVIRGDRQIPILNQNPENKPVTSECFWGPFSRAIVLPEYTEINKIEASFKKNILIITIPKNQQPQSRTIKIQHQE
ncbi:hypothetical protein CVV38_04280 [Candidatus Peregrinibacteria bacterium HGW-Peregrinibacteria-1]|jgi:HSP20 family protein|nr:MAG: hypothetical protein CVV38_04280 [Candidatus Peregrinibacteria bacterium HGW-Peregrinibacteria-1]